MGLDELGLGMWMLFDGLGLGGFRARSWALRILRWGCWIGGITAQESETLSRIWGWQLSSRIVHRFPC